MSEKGTRDEINDTASGAETVPVVARLCYVDDSRTSAYVVRRLLQPYGYQVDHFASAEPAFVALVQEDYDLLLTDLKVSSKGMDGDDLIRTLRQSGHPKISTMPIIVITGATDAEALVSVYEAGANQVMKKPVDAEELDGHIRRLLSDVLSAKAKQAELAESKASKRHAGDATVVPLRAAQRPSREAEEASAPSSRESLLYSSDTHIPTLTEDAAREELKATSESTTGANDSSIFRAMEKEAFEKELKDRKTRSEADGAQPEHRPAETEQPKTEQFESEQTETNRTDQAEVIIDEPEIMVDTSVVEDEDEVVIIEPEERKERNARRQSYDDHNILGEIEQYPLVITQRRSLFGGNTLSNMLHSLIELVGVRHIVSRGLAIVLAVAALFFAWNTYFNPGLPVDTVLVESGEIFQSITVPGRIVSKQRVNVSSARAGRLVELLVKEGDKVKQGQVLARLDDRELISRLNQANANLSAARENINLADRTLKRLRTAHSKGAVARRFVEDAEVELRAARTKAGIAVEEVKSATLDVDKQQVKAAFDGTITARLAEIGQWVGPTETLYTLVDESQREVELRVDAADSAAIDVGQVVMMSSDAFPGLEWQESVVRLGAEAGGSQNVNSVKVYVSLGDDAPVFRYGQQVDAEIRTAWNPNTLKVPFEALISRDGHTMVAVLEEGKVQMKIVETGIEDFSMAEIKQGLNAGEMVILSRGQLLKNGDRVYPKRDKQ